MPSAGLPDGYEPSGTLNFRDVGGIPAGAGRRVARGRLFRSDTVQFLTRDDVDVLVRDLGLRTVVDLRLGYELRIEGRGLLEHEPVRHVHLPFIVEGAVRQGTATPILSRKDPIVSHYLGYLASSPGSVAGVVHTLAGADALPAIVHCAAGKDRTGVAVAVVLAAVGVTAADIATEYAASADRVVPVMERLRGMKSYGDAVDRLPPEANITPPEYMLRFLDAVGERYGGMRAFLLSNGVTQEELDRLTERLTSVDSPAVALPPEPAAPSTTAPTGS